jgi:GMP synthase-like glutamine amidotransferase
MTRALVLRHHLEDHSGLIGEAFESRGYEIDLRMMNEHSATPSLEGYDVFVILGSKSAVYDKEVEQAWFGREIELIAEAVRRDIPVFGICFGAQALCLFHGGIVERSNEPEIGWYEVDAHNDSGIATGPWFEFHFDHCLLPEDAQLWATSPRAVQAFCVGRNVGVQFHPEIDHLQLKDWFASGIEEARDFGVDVDALIEQTKLETPAARERALDLVDLFLTHIKN